MTSHPLHLLFIDLPLDPMPKGRPRFGRGHAHTPEHTRHYERCVASLLRAERGVRELMAGPVQLYLCFVMLRPKRPARPYPSRADTDNLGKAILDAANKIVWQDDIQLVDVRFVKRYATGDEKPHIVFHATDLSY